MSIDSGWRPAQHQRRRSTALSSMAFVNNCEQCHVHSQMGSADPPGKMDEKLKSENMQKRAIF